MALIKTICYLFVLTGNKHFKVIEVSNITGNDKSDKDRPLLESKQNFKKKATQLFSGVALPLAQKVALQHLFILVKFFKIKSRYEQNSYLLKN